MASTYSSLKIELIATGEQSGTWGTTTNNNLGDAALGEAITGSADVAFSSADVTVTLTDSNASQAARNLRLNLTGTSGGARQLILGSGCQIEKLYLINNGLADAVTVKNTSGTGIAVPAGKSMFVYNNGTNVVDAVTHLSSLTLGSALPVTSGGTGSTSTTFVNLASNVTGTLPVANGGTGQTTLQNAMDALAGAVTSGQYLRGNGADVVMSAIQAGDVPTLNQNTSGTAGGLSATLAVSSGGTGASTLTSNNVILGAGTSAVTFVAPGSNGNVLTSNGSTWTSAAAGGGGSFQTQLFTSPGTWTKPASATQVRVTVIGGGGGSGATNAPTVGASGGTSSFGPAVSATGGAGSPQAAAAANGSGTVSVGTALKTGKILTASLPGPFNQLYTMSQGVITGESVRFVPQPTPAPQVPGVAYSTSLTFMAGIGGNSYGGSGGLAIAIVPVSAPVTVTVGAGGAGSQPPFTPFGTGGVGGAVLVEFVG